jgi:hypothetical protein
MRHAPWSQNLVLLHGVLEMEAIKACYGDITIATVVVDAENHGIQIKVRDKVTNVTLDEYGDRNWQRNFIKQLNNPKHVRQLERALLDFSRAVIGRRNQIRDK